MGAVISAVWELTALQEHNPRGEVDRPPVAPGSQNTGVHTHMHTH